MSLKIKMDGLLSIWMDHVEKMAGLVVVEYILRGSQGEWLGGFVKYIGYGNAFLTEL
jgi:hypothetical protein